MGNSCSGKRNHSKDTISFNSNESLCYEICKNDTFDDKVKGHQAVITKDNKHIVSGSANSIFKNSKNVITGETLSVNTFNADNDSYHDQVNKETKHADLVLLDSLTLFPDVIKSLLTGHRSLSSQSKKIVLFTIIADSKGFSDERKILNSVIIPKLRAYTNSQLFELFPVNLSGDSKKNDRKLLELSQWEFKRQIQSSYIVPIILFNGFLDNDFLVPPILHESDITTLTENDAGTSLIESLYEKHSTVFKLRENCEKSDLDAFVKLILELPKNEDKENYLKLRFQEELRLIFQKNFELSKKAFLITKSLPERTDNDNVVKEELTKRVNSIQNELKIHIAEKNIIKIPRLMSENDKNEFVNNSCKILINIIDNIIEQYRNSTMIRSFYGLRTNEIEEINENLKFIEPLIKFSLMRDNIFKKIIKYLENGNQLPLILKGTRGSGKTTLIAQVVNYCQHNLANSIVIVRFAQISKVDRIECLLHSVLNQCSILLNGKPLPPLVHTLQVFKDTFEKFLEEFAKLKRSFILLFDGVDQICGISSGHDEYLLDEWLPEKLPSNNIKIIVTMNSNCSERFTNILEVPELSRDKILLWSSDNEALLNINEQIIRLINDFELKFERDKTEIVFNYFVAFGKLGVTESEIFDLLLADNLFDNNCSIVQEFFLDFIQMFHLFLTWFQSDGYYLVAVKSDLHLHVIKSYYHNYKCLYQQIHNYYNGKLSADFDMNNDWSKNRKLELLSIIAAFLDKKMYNESKYVCDLEHIFEKLTNVSCCKVLNDFYRIDIDKMSTSQKKFMNFFEKYAFQLNYDSRQFYGYLNDFISDNQITNWDEVESCIKNPPVISLTLVNEIDQHSTAVLSGRVDKVFRLKHNENFVIGICSSKNEVCVWDIERCKPVRILRNIEKPVNVLNIDQYKCIILCNRELKIFDLNEGKFLTKLKGVMNQKMPFYGLHDDQHVITLSRNRMYVNLMNIETGDCLTTFKAGEDRFLNSLLVSGNGQILVCGDETQKPFPLLVWNLKSRKLLYDLRISHHDFVTSLAAITYEGDFMCCVCHEINEPNPNFIVVYDLQSGTLFKKWKSHYNTVSIEISSPSGCVISGLDNAEIFVWDLMTGNCRWKLCGHTAPVTSLRLDPPGLLCLSRNLSGHDPSIRIWNLKSGQLVAVYTPINQIIDCELTSHYILLIVEDTDKILTLKVIGQDSDTSKNRSQFYGLEENNEKIFEIFE